MAGLIAQVKSVEQKLFVALIAKIDARILLFIFRQMNETSQPA
jgi:hypothetical protein